MMVDVMLVSGHLSLVSLFRTPLVKTLIGLTPVQFKKKKRHFLYLLCLYFSSILEPGGPVFVL